MSSMIDITYCTNSDCGITSCYRHVLWADKTKPNSFADFEDCPYWGLRGDCEKKERERPMNDLISRQYAIDLIQYAGKIGKQTCISILKRMPSAQAESCDGCKWEGAYGYGECHHCRRGYEDMYEVENDAR